MIHIVATAVKSGKGGISTALIGFCESDSLSDVGVNIIESHNETKPRLASFKLAARRLKNEVKPGDVVWIHCARWLSMLRKYLLARIAKRQGAKVFIQFHSTVTSDYAESFFGRVLLRRLYHIADGICVLSEWWRRLFVERLGFAGERIYIVPNPLDKRFEQLATQSPYKAPSPAQVHILAMTRLVPGKNVGAVIESMTRLPPRYTLTVAGDGPLREALQARAKQLKLEDRVLFTGWVDYDEKIQLLKQQDIFVLPSQFDAFGMGFLEAMSAGLPVVALRTGPTADVVPHGRAGVLVDDCAPQTLADAIEGVMAEHQRLSTSARHYVASNYPADSILPGLLRFFQRDYGHKQRLLGRIKQSLISRLEPLQVALSGDKLPLLYYNRTANVGDALNPYIIERLSGRKTYRLLRGQRKHVLGIGSILHISTPHSHVWGSGLLDDARIPPRSRLEKMSFYALRGELTKRALARQGADVENVVLGDPAVLMPELYPGRPTGKRYRIGMVPHYADKHVEALNAVVSHNDIVIIDVQQPPESFIDALLSCDFIFSSSLHGVILADAYKVPNAWVKFSDYAGIGEFKFNDYFSTTDKQSAALVIDSAAQLKSAIETAESHCCVRNFLGDTQRLKDALPQLFS